MNFELLAERTRYLKNNPKGVSEMCKVIEDMRTRERKETMKEIALRMMKARLYALEEIVNISGLPLDEVKKLNQKENIFAASTVARASQIYSTVSGRIRMLDESFYQVFLASDLATQKLFALVAAMAYDTLFFDFIYEVIREKMIIGSNQLADSDIRIFFKNKQMGK